MLGLGALAAAFVKLLEILFVVKWVALGFPLNGYPASSMGFKLDPSFLMVAVGGLVGIRVAASMMVGAILAATWVVGKIYRVGILMHGSKPKLKDLMRWVREA
mgnify:CR=1 FL=1